MSGSVAGGALVAFDLGGVLVRLCTDLAHACRVAGVRPRGEPVIRDPNALRSLTGAHQRGELPHQAFLEGMSHCLGGVLDASEVGRLHDAWILGEYEGVGELLDELRSTGTVTACLSNTNAAHWEQLRASPAFMRIGARHASHALGLAKPDAAAFRAFEREVGVPAASLVLFDDLPGNVAAARSCGWTAFEVDHAGDTAAQVLGALRGMGAMA